MSHIKIEIIAETEGDLLRMVGALSRLLARENVDVDKLDVETIRNDQGEVLVHAVTAEAAKADPEKPKRGRPRKVTPETNPPAAEAEAADTPPSDAETFDPEPEPETAPTPTDPKAALAEAMTILRSVFARGAAGAKAVQEIRAKFGVKKFDEVPADRALELLAQAQAADQATGAVAA